MNLPGSILSAIGSADYSLDTIGRSGAGVLLFPEAVLKIQPEGPEARREANMLRWLRGQLPVPEVFLEETAGGTSYLLMERLPGKMACDPEYMRQPRLQQTLLAGAIRELWSVDISNCPSDQRLPGKLAAARERVALGLVDMEDAMPDTFGPGGFRDAQALLYWLQDNQPQEELALSHGDLCLPNLFFRKAA